MTARPTPLTVVACLALLCPAAAHADVHKIDLAFAPSYVNLSSLFGVHASVAASLGGGSHRSTRAGQPRARHPWAVVGDLAAHFVGDEDTEVTTMLGFRRTVWTRRGAGPDQVETRTGLFVQALGGVTHRVNVLERATDPAAAVGAGLDVLTSADRMKGFRIQADYIFAEGDSYPRVSAGFVYRLDW